VAVIQFNTDDRTASRKRSAVRPATEAAGNFVLVLAFGIAIATHSWFAPMLIGAPLVAMLVSGNRAPHAYYNPSLTFAMLMHRRITIPDALALWLIQSGSGLLAAMLVCVMVGPAHLAVTAATMTGSTLLAVFTLELIITCALCFVALDRSRANRSAAVDYNNWPIAVVLVISVIAFGCLSWPTLWIYLVSQLFSGIAATITFVSFADQ
jgi:glycerol uptake facilitator-like aquaporin